MGTDCVWIARNLAGLTPEDLPGLLAGAYPGGTGEFVQSRDHKGNAEPCYRLSQPRSAYHWIEFSGPWIAVHDGCRRFFAQPERRQDLTVLVKMLSGDSDPLLVGDSVYAESEIEALWAERVRRRSEGFYDEDTE
jgi:hypothetical protein